MRNMKKWLGIVATGVMCFALGMTAVAAPSPSADGIVQEITASTDANGNAVDVEIVELTEEGKAAAQQLDEAAFVKELVGTDFVEGMKVLDIQEVEGIGGSGCSGDNKGCSSSL